jgi:hypothetical protein
MRRWLILLALLPNCTGCLCYAYPTIAYTPELPVDNHDNAAYVFRVDVDRTERTPGTASTQYTLMQIPLDRFGVVPSQLEVAPAAGIWNPFHLGDAKELEHSTYTLLIRCYKAGCQTMEVQAWDRTKPLQWLPARDLSAQEKAIDDLLADPAAPINGHSPAPGGYFHTVPTLTSWWEMKDQKNPQLGLQPGSASVEQRKTLIFASTEYQRLANGPLAAGTQMQAARERLQQKAIWLRRFAEQAAVVNR